MNSFFILIFINILMERSILGIKCIDRLCTTVLAGIADVGRNIAKLKYDRAGHVIRMQLEK